MVTGVSRSGPPVSIFLELFTDSHQYKCELNATIVKSLSPILVRVHIRICSRARGRNGAFIGLAAFAFEHFNIVGLNWYHWRQMHRCDVYLYVFGGQGGILCTSLLRPREPESARLAHFLKAWSSLCGKRVEFDPTVMVRWVPSV